MNDFYALPFSARYRLIRGIQGGMADVYCAVERSSRVQHTAPRTVLIKVLPKGERGKPAPEARLRREGLLLGRIRHPNVPRLIETGHEAGVTYIVMEFIPSVSLHRLLLRALELGRPIPQGMALRWIGDVLSAIGELERAGIAHCDLSSSNILVAFSSLVAITADLGLATEVAQPASFPAGTDGYLDPADATPGARRDRYALGVVAVSLLGGHPEARVEYRGQEPVLDGWDEPVRAFLRGLLSLDLTQRFQTHDQAFEAHRRCLVEGDGEPLAMKRYLFSLFPDPATSNMIDPEPLPPSRVAPKPEPPRPAPRERPRRRFLAFTVGLIVLFILSSLGVVLTRPRPAPEQARVEQPAMIDERQEPPSEPEAETQEPEPPKPIREETRRARPFRPDRPRFDADVVEAPQPTPPPSQPPPSQPPPQGLPDREAATHAVFAMGGDSPVRFGVADALMKRYLEQTTHDAGDCLLRARLLFLASVFLENANLPGRNPPPEFARPGVWKRRHDQLLAVDHCPDDEEK